jgi:hypothetical protein
LITACWAQNPDSRPSVGQIVELLQRDRVLVFTGTDEDELREYEQRVLHGLEELYALSDTFT